MMDREEFDPYKDKINNSLNNKNKQIRELKETIKELREELGWQKEEITEIRDMLEWYQGR